MTADLLLYGLVAAGLVIWLRNILGTRHGDERERPNPFTPVETEKTTSAFKPAEEPAISLGLDASTQNHDLPRNAVILDRAQEGLSDISAADRHFSPSEFLSGAERAFVMIVTAFAAGDRQTLQDLLSAEVFSAFDTVIKGRERDGQTVTTEIHAVRKMEILDALVRDRRAYVTVQFTADETCVVRAKGGEILSGDPDKITQMCDIWVFSRDVKSKNPAWELVETRDGEAEEGGKTPLPFTA